MDTPPINKRFRVYTRTATIAELLISMPLENVITDVILTHYPTSDDDNDTSVLYTIKNTELASELINIYGEWSIVYNSTENPEVNPPNNWHNPGEPIKAFKNLWYDYIKYNKDNWRRIVTALAAKYDPISNYDRHEDINYTDKLTKTGTIEETHDNYNYGTNTGTITDVNGSLANVTLNVTEPFRNETTHKVTEEEATPATIDTDSPVLAGVTTTISSATFDDENAVLSNKTNTQGMQQTIPNTTSYSKNLNDHTTGFNNYTETNEHTTSDKGSRIYGNIGVTTSATMVKEILDVYKYDILHEIISGFAKRYLVYLPVDEELEREECCYGIY